MISRSDITVYYKIYLAWFGALIIASAVSGWVFMKFAGAALSSGATGGVTWSKLIEGGIAEIAIFLVGAIVTIIVFQLLYVILLPLLAYLALRTDQILRKKTALILAGLALCTPAAILLSLARIISFDQALVLTLFWLLATPLFGRVIATRTTR